MFQTGKKVVYRDEVCLVTDIVKKYKNDEDYYVLTSIHDATLCIRVPVATASVAMRRLITQSEIQALIHKIPDLPIVPIGNWNRGIEYKELLNDGSHESMARIIKTAYLRQQEKVQLKQKPNESDKQYFRQAEQRLYSEVAAALELSYDEAKEYIVSEVAAWSTKNEQ